MQHSAYDISADYSITKKKAKGFSPVNLSINILSTDPPPKE